MLKPTPNLNHFHLSAQDQHSGEGDMKERRGAEVDHMVHEALLTSVKPSTQDRYRRMFDVAERFRRGRGEEEWGRDLAIEFLATRPVGGRAAYRSAMRFCLKAERRPAHHLDHSDVATMCRAGRGNPREDREGIIGRNS